MSVDLSNQHYLKKVFTLLFLVYLLVSGELVGANARSVSNPITLVSFFQGIPQSVIWGYNNSLVIAQVTNARTNQIYHTSFEEGSATEEIGTDPATGSARTGKKVKVGNTFIIPADKRPVAGSYVLSYWEQVSGVWQYREQTISYTPAATSLFTTTNVIDEVRIYPATARMMTYTYDPLVGKTSETNANNLTTYYEYDEFNRLKLVRDNEGNIVKNYYYHYKQ
jgi:YD repeat-containing protein